MLKEGDKGRLQKKTEKDEETKQLEEPCRKRWQQHLERQEELRQERQREQEATRKQKEDETERLKIEAERRQKVEKSCFQDDDPGAAYDAAAAPVKKRKAQTGREEKQAVHEKGISAGKLRVLVFIQHQQN